MIYNFVCSECYPHSLGQFAFLLFNHMGQEEDITKILSFLLS